MKRRKSSNPIWQPPMMVKQIIESGICLLKHRPMAGMEFLDPTYIFVLPGNRLTHIFVDDDNWEIRKFSRDPFGDYSNVYTPLGSGKGFEYLKRIVESL